ncbi:hypothetical protein JYQ62_12185 [Nostoc sp. UHCC 0702]|nr:hypothetical protein JYQ62_12185 [Nostoc sp. UHCC 0702]
MKVQDGIGCCVIVEQRQFLSRGAGEQGGRGAGGQGGRGAGVMGRNN